MTVASRSTLAPGEASEMCSFALDAWFDDVSVLTDEHALLAAMHEAAVAGGAIVVGQASAVFPNRAVTAALLLAESHLTVHTWPERGFATFDLLTCGRLNGEAIISCLRSRLSPTCCNVTHHSRHLLSPVRQVEAEQQHVTMPRGGARWRDR